MSLPPRAVLEPIMCETLSSGFGTELSFSQSFQIEITCNLLEAALCLFALLFTMLSLQHCIMQIRDKGFTQATDTKIVIRTQPCLLYKRETDIIISFQVQHGVIHQNRSTKDTYLPFKKNSPFSDLADMKFRYFEEQNYLIFSKSEKGEFFLRGT